MKWVLRFLGGAAVLLALASVGVLAAARLHDGPFGGPLEIVAAGPFRSGELYAGPREPDWGFLRDYPTVHFQLVDPPRSRTTWIMEHEGRIFIASGYMNTTWGKLWKQWPKEAEADGRAVLRVDGTLYERQMVRIREDDAVAAPVLAELGRKYLGGAGVPVSEVASGSIWLFELRPRS